jgi:hypothetical protein
MAFTGNEEHVVSFEEAKELKDNYQEHAGVEDILAFYYGKTFLLSVLNQQGCVGIRVYNGRKEDGKLELVIVGVNADGDDMTSGIMGDRSVPCPPYCGSPW